jgi:hypothetical protein
VACFGGRRPGAAGVFGGEASPTPSAGEDEEEALLLDPLFRSPLLGLNRRS